MKILKPKPRILVYEKLKGTSQFKKLMAKYKIQKKLSKKTKETIIDQIKNEMEKNESDDDYIIKEEKVEEKAEDKKEEKVEEKVEEKKCTNFKTL